jgi:DNA polymerase-3 subunit epsilon
MQTAIEQAVTQLSSSPDFRVLRRVPPLSEFPMCNADGEVVRAVVVDCETTGLDPVVDEVIELAILPFEYERATGRLVSIGEPFHSFREPSVPIGDSEKVHGISPAMVAGHSITNEQVTRATFGAQLAIAHNAGFDRPQCEDIAAVFEDMVWACSLADIDWRSEGLQTAKLDYLLLKQGWFFDGHRATDDAAALLWLLTLQLPGSGRLTLSAMLEQARKPLTIVQAIDTNFDNRALLKSRGYHWEPGTSARAKAWWTATTDPDAEVEWHKSSPCWQRGTRVALRAVPPKLRYSSRLWSAQ